MVLGHINSVIILTIVNSGVLYRTIKLNYSVELNKYY
jgi:hypothetical protein